MAQEQLLTAAQVAKAIGWHWSNVRLLCKRRVFPAPDHIGPRGAYAWRPETVAAWVAFEERKREFRADAQRLQAEAAASWGRCAGARKSPARAA